MGTIYPHPTPSTFETGKIKAPILTHPPRMVWQKDRTTESKKVCLGKPLERAGKLQTQHRGTATISANCAHRPNSEGGVSHRGALQLAEVLPTSYRAIQHRGMGILLSRRLIASEGRGKEQLTRHTPRIYTAPTCLQSKYSTTRPPRIL